MSLFSELQRRSVFRVAASYAVIGWLVLQIADVVLDPLGAPDWSMRALIVLVVIGFPAALVLAWTFELTPEGVERDRRAPEEQRPAVHGVRRYADVLVIGVLLIVIAVLLSRQQPIDFEVTDTPVVAVLPFTEIGTDDNIFGMGLADTLIHKLGQLQELVVLTSSSTFEFAGTSLDLAEVGAKLGANILLEGTVQRGADRLRVNARLVEAQSGQQIWSDNYERAAADLFAVQDEIASEVSGALSVVLSEEQQERMAEPVTSSLTAFDAYTLGLVNFARRGQSGVENAVKYLREAVRLDPDFALAQARLAQVLYAVPYYSPLEYQWADIREEADEAATAALRLAPNSGDSYLARYYVHKAEETFAGQPTASPEEFEALVRTAAELSPNNARAFRELAQYTDDASQKIAYLERAARLDPRSGIIKYDIALAFAESGDYEAAVDWLLKAANTAEPFFRMGYVNIAIFQAFYAGRFDEAVRWSGLMAEKLGEWFWPAHFNNLMDLAAFAEAELALQEIAALGESNEAFRLWAAIYRAFLTWHLGDVSGAEQQLESAITTELTQLPGWPDLTQLTGAEWIMALAVAFDVRDGQPQRALERYRAAFPDPGIYRATFKTRIYLHPLVMTGALLKLNGRDEEGRSIIREYLEQETDYPINTRAGTGFNRFVAYALLGEVDSARQELQAAVELNFLANLSMLSIPDFDAEYIAVMTDPVVSELYRELLDIRQAQLQAYRAQPNLPPERIPESLITISEKLRSP